MSLTLKLGAHYESLVRGLVESGRYDDEAAVVRHALGILEQVEAARAARVEELRRLIQEGLDSGDGGEWDKDAFLREAHARFEARRAAAE